MSPVPGDGDASPDATAPSEGGTAATREEGYENEVSADSPGEEGVEPETTPDPPSRTSGGFVGTAPGSVGGTACVGSAVPAVTANASGGRVGGDEQRGEVGGAGKTNGFGPAAVGQAGFGIAEASGREGTVIGFKRPSEGSSSLVRIAPIPIDGSRMGDDVHPQPAKR